MRLRSASLDDLLQEVEVTLDDDGRCRALIAQCHLVFRYWEFGRNCGAAYQANAT